MDLYPRIRNTHLRILVLPRNKKYQYFKKVAKMNFFPSFLFLEPGWQELWIRDKHLGSATLINMETGSWSNQVGIHADPIPKHSNFIPTFLAERDRTIKSHWIWADVVQIGLMRTRYLPKLSWIIMCSVCLFITNGSKH
jgi:hypothetical protein